MSTMTDVSRRTYGQFCGLAHALDVVGERWTLLIVRELASGPKRYSELADSLAGIGTSLLANRVRQLETDGVVHRRLALDQPGSAVVYELSDAGRELASALVPLATWGARHQMTDADADTETFRAEWVLGFLAADVRRAGPHDLDAVFEFHIDDSTAHLRMLDGSVTVTSGPSSTPGDVTVRCQAATIAAIVGGQLSIEDALDDGRLDVSGDPSTVTTLLGVLERMLGR